MSVQRYSPGQMDQHATEMKGHHAALDSQHQATLQAHNQLLGVWHGDAVEPYRAAFAPVDQALTRVKEALAASTRASQDSLQRTIERDQAVGRSLA